MLPNRLKHEYALNVLDVEQLVADGEWLEDLERQLDRAKEKAPAGETQSARSGSDAV